MRIFTCKHQLEDMMTCIYDAWVYALRVGHDKVQDGADRAGNFI
mgnify:CR=1 FL=1